MAHAKRHFLDANCSVDAYCKDAEAAAFAECLHQSFAFASCPGRVGTTLLASALQSGRRSCRSRARSRVDVLQALRSEWPSSSVERYRP